MSRPNSGGEVSGSVSRIVAVLRTKQGLKQGPQRLSRAVQAVFLHVVDGSFFVSSGAVNPALTIMANALRVGDHLLERLR